ncbi:MAG: phosphomethylpyrimidine synthase ThiC [Dehalococcoidia bacterium]|nr:phosphomethylpyrimidine synthase ThiC [Dehalococcoidia bacterium]
MDTLVERARKGLASPLVERVAQDEGVDVEFVRKGVAEGTIVIPANRRHRFDGIRAIGKGLRTKINANVGTSAETGNESTELAKLKAAAGAGADAVMDLSTGGDLPGIRRALVTNCGLPIGSVPIYQAAVDATNAKGSIVDMTVDGLFDAIEDHLRDGIDFITVHCGITQSAISRLREQKRVTDVVSRGGSFLIGWMLHNDRENPLFEHYDRLLDLARQYDATLSLGDGMRPGSLADASDAAQLQELITLGELVRRARAAGVQAMVEGPGHMPLDQIAANMKLQQTLCDNAPFYVLGPLVTDIGAGYDHITGAIGGAIAAAAGADFLCYVTPSEHLSLPSIEDVREGVIASRIAAHAADIVKGVKGAAEWDRRMSVARKNLDWETQISLSLNPERAREVHNRNHSKGTACSMCGPFCAMEIMAKHLGTQPTKC